MVIILKIVILIYVLVLGSVEYILYNQFKESKLTEEYDNSNMFGKLIAHSLFFITSSAIASTLIFLFYILFSKITIG